MAEIVEPTEPTTSVSMPPQVGRQLDSGLPAGGRADHHQDWARRRAQQAVDRWRRAQRPPAQTAGAKDGLDTAPSAPGRTTTAGDGVFASLPRRQAQFRAGEGDQRRVRQRQETFAAGSLATTWRLLHWIWIALRFAGAVGWDWIRRRNTQERRARRLRHTLQAAGLTAIKVGQQLSMRIDILPYAYAAELEKLLDAVPPFPLEQAIAEIEASAGRPLADVFAVFDPTPIGSASISCVYQAVLHSGERVAVKVRRPNIGNDLAADLSGLAILLKFTELFWLPPRFSNNFMRELTTMLFGELDFVNEARSIEIFRRRVKKAKIRYVRAPKVYFRLSNRRVLVEEFVSGVWLTEVLAIVEGKNEAGFEYLRSLAIDPTLVAGRLLRATRWAGFEGLLFHADLHPANIIVSPGSVLMLVDFGAVGAFTERERTIWRRFLYAQQIEDVGAMARAALNLLEPLPPIDIDELISETEAVFWQDLYAYRSKHAEWWEKTSARIWMSFLGLARSRNIPLNLNTLRMIRATLLVDTLALRLDANIDHYREYAKYEQGAGKRARKRLEGKLREMLSVRSFIEVEQMFEASRSILYRLQRSLDMPVARYSRLIGKSAYTAIAALNLALTLVAGTCAVGFVVAVVRRFQGSTQAVEWWRSVVDLVLPSGLYQAGVVVITASACRWVYYHLRGREG